MADEIGRAKIVIEADTEGIKGSISDAKSEVEDLGDAGEVAGEKVGGGFLNAGEQIDKSTEGIRKFQGAISGAIGAVTGLVAIGTTLVGVLVAIASKSKKAKEESFALAAAYHDIEQSINDYNKSQGRTLDTDREQYFATLRQIEANKDLTNEYRQQLIEKANAVMLSNQLVGDDEKRKESLALWEAFFRTKAMLEAELADDAIQSEQLLYEARKQNLNKLFGESGNGYMYRQLEEIEDKLHKKRIANIEDEKQRKIQAEEEAARKAAELAERQAAMIAKAIRREMENLSDALFGTGGNNLTTKLDTLVSELRQIKDDMGALR